MILLINGIAFVGGLFLLVIGILIAVDAARSRLLDLMEGGIAVCAGAFVALSGVALMAMTIQFPFKG